MQPAPTPYCDLEPSKNSVQISIPTIELVKQKFSISTNFFSHSHQFECNEGVRIVHVLEMKMFFCKNHGHVLKNNSPKLCEKN
jgi:hypothetical protein